MTKKEMINNLINKWIGNEYFECSRVKKLIYKKHSKKEIEDIYTSVFSERKINLNFIIMQLIK